MATYITLKTVPSLPEGDLPDNAVIVNSSGDLDQLGAGSVDMDSVPDSAVFVKDTVRVNSADAQTDLESMLSERGATPKIKASKLYEDSGTNSLIDSAGKVTTSLTTESGNAIGTIADQAEIDLGAMLTARGEAPKIKGSKLYKDDGSGALITSTGKVTSSLQTESGNALGEIADAANVDLNVIVAGTRGAGAGIKAQKLMSADDFTPLIDASDQITTGLKTATGNTISTAADAANTGLDLTTGKVKINVPIAFASAEMPAIDSGTGKLDVTQNTSDGKPPFTSLGGTIDGNVTVVGNLTVQGTQFIINTEIVQVEDNVMLLNYGEVGAGVTGGTAGIEIDRGSLNNYQFVFDESDDAFKIGEAASLLPVATRQDTPTNTGVAYWDSTGFKFNTSSNLVFDGTNLGIGSTPTYTLDIIKSLDGVIYTSVNNSNIGSSAIAGYIASSDTAILYVRTHSDARVATQFGTAVGGYSEITSSGGMMLGTTGAAQLIIGTNNVARLTIASGGVANFSVTPTVGGTAVTLVGHAHATGDVTSGTFADARVAQSNVTQHQAALSLTWSQLTDAPNVQYTSAIAEGNSGLVPALGSANQYLQYDGTWSIPAGGSHSLDSHSNVTITTIATGELLKWSGAAWINNTLAEAGISDTSHTHAYLSSSSSSAQSGYFGAVYIKEDTHYMVLDVASDLTADRALTFDLNDTARTLSIHGDTTLSGGTHSGTNTGDQTITLTGDVTGTGTGSFAATIANDAVTYAKMQNISATSKILGRATAGAGNTEELTAAQVKTILSLNNVENTAVSTWAGTSNITTIAASAVTAHQAALSIAWSQITSTPTTVAGYGITDVAYTSAISEGISGLVPSGGLATEFLYYDGTWVTPSGSSHSLDSHSNVTITTIATGELLKWSGSAWINNTLAEANIAPAASPTFTGTVTIPTPFTLGAVSVTTTGTQLNYLSAATGTTGTASTNVVFSTSPTLVTPVLGVATGTSLDLGGTTLYASRAITVDTGGVLNIVLASVAGDDFTVDTNKLVVEGDTGNVGIGTATPGSMLHVLGDTADESLFKVEGTNGVIFELFDTVTGTLFAVNDGSGIPILQVDADDTVLMAPYAATPLVGIGVTDPDTALEILYAGNQLKLSFDGTDNAVFAVDTSGNLTITPSGTTVDIAGAFTASTITSDAGVAGTTGTFSGILSVDDTTDSTSGTTGSIHTDGGIGIAKALYVGSNVGVRVAPVSNVGLLIAGSTITANATHGTGLGIDVSLTASANSNELSQLSATYTNVITKGAYTGLTYGGIYIDNSGLTTTGAGTIDHASGIYIKNAPTAIGTSNYALFIDAGNSRFDGAIYLQDMTAPSPTTNELYANSGNLYWNGISLTGGGSLPSPTLGYILRGFSGSVWESTDDIFINDSAQVGIGVTAPDTKLEVFYAGNQLKLSFDVTDNAVFAVDTAGVLTITPSGAALALGTKNITMTGSIGATAARVTKGWFTDLESTNDITIGGTALATLYQPLHAALTSISGLTEAAGTLIYGTADNAYATLAAGATTTILVGGGAAAPVWTTVTGTGAPVRATTPTLITPVLGVATGTSLDLGGTTLYGSRAITVDTGGVLNIVLASVAGDDFTVDTDKLVVEGDTGNVGIGITGPGTLLHIAKDGNAYLTLQNLTAENTEGGAETKIIFEDHSNTALAQIQASHDGIVDDTKGDLIFYTHNGTTLTEAVRIASTQITDFVNMPTVSGSALALLSNVAYTSAISEGNSGLVPSIGSIGEFLYYNGTWATPSYTSHTIDGHSNVVITSKATNDILIWNGSNWVNSTRTGAGLMVDTHPAYTITGLTDTVTTTSSTIVASATAVKLAYDRGDNYLLLTGGTLTGDLTISNSNTPYFTVYSNQQSIIGGTDLGGINWSAHDSTAGESRLTAGAIRLEGDAIWDNTLANRDSRMAFRVLDDGVLTTKATLDADGNLNVLGAGTFSGILSVDDVTNSTSGTTGSIHTDGGLGVALDAFIIGSLGATGTRVTKGWFTNLESTNDITIGGTALAATYQPLHAALTSISGLTETNGGMLYGTASNAYAWLAAGTSGYVLQGNGAGAPSWLDIVSTYQPLHAALTSISGLTEAAGTLIYGTADNAYATLAAGATTTILVGGGAAAPVWTTVTGTGAPVKANTPTLITPEIGVATGTSLDLGAALYATRSITVDTGGVFNIVLASVAGDDFTVDTDKLVVEGDTGNVGIGVTDPDTLLQLYKVGTQLKLSGGDADYATFAVSAAGLLTITTVDLDAALGHIALMPDGNVGIGVADPAFKLEVNGSFAATTKSFVIEHPTVQGMILEYGAIESPYHGIRLTGDDVIEDDECVVQLPDYIDGLIHSENTNVQITNIGHDKTLYVKEIDIPNQQFVVGVTRGMLSRNKPLPFYWTFTGVRKDVDLLVPERYR